jgi:hypothetical protein
MRFELLHALRGLNERTPEFFVTEALGEPNPGVRNAALEALTAAPTTVSATAILKAKLKLA